MKIELWGIGKTKIDYLLRGEDEYEKRLKHYVTFQQKIFEHPKGWSKLAPTEIKKKEAQILLEHLKPEDYVLLLDEIGKQYTSLEFADQLQNYMNQGLKKVVFIVGGAFGFDDSLRQRAASAMSLSKLTFTHQMVRLFFLEQLYRAMTIIKNESYHNQ